MRLQNVGGQASVNADYDNKVAVLVGDYVLSTALLHVSYTHSEIIVRRLAELGRTLSDGEILQLANIQSKKVTEEVYYKIIERKTAALLRLVLPSELSLLGLQRRRLKLPDFLVRTWNCLPNSR